MSKTRHNALLFLVLVGLLISVLAMGLRQVVLLPGQPFSLEVTQPQTAGTAGAMLPGGGLFINLFRGLIAVLLVLLPVYVIYSLMNKEGRKRLIVQVALIILLFLIGDYLQEHRPENESPQQIEAMSSREPGDQTGGSLPSAVFSPEPPQWLTLVILLAGSLLLAVFIFSITRLLRPPDSPGTVAFEELAEEVESAIVSLHAGGDFRTTIMRCYQEMSRVLKQEKGIDREKAMTPREFESRLLNTGLPPESIRTLTRLFEQVRYGHFSASPRERDLALSSLTAIVDACRVIVDGHE